MDNSRRTLLKGILGIPLFGSLACSTPQPLIQRGVLDRRSLYTGTRRFLYESHILDLFDDFLENPHPYPGTYPFASMETFANIPSDLIGEHLLLKEASSVSLLYPGAGTHLSPLELMLGLKNTNPSLKEAKLAYTEIQESKLEEFEKHVQRIRTSQQPPLNFSIQDKKIITENEEKEVIYTLDAFGNKIQLAYLFNRPTSSNEEYGLRSQETRRKYTLEIDPDNEDHPYFTKKQTDTSNIILFHDSFTHHPDVLGALYYTMIRSSKNEKQKAIIFDDIARVAEGKSPMHIYDVLPGEKRLIAGDYGCFHNDSDGTYRQEYKACVLYFPNQPLLAQIHNQPEQERQLKENIKKLYTDKY